jgi:hypothetical protein
MALFLSETISDVSTLPAVEASEVAGALLEVMTAQNQGNSRAGLARKAFALEDGPHTDGIAEAGQEQALGDLTASELGRRRNPDSHRRAKGTVEEARRDDRAEQSSPPHR